VSLRVFECATSNRVGTSMGIGRDVVEMEGGEGRVAAEGREVRSWSGPGSVVDSSNAPFSETVLTLMPELVLG